MSNYIFSTVLLQVGDFIGDVFEFGFWAVIIIIVLIGAAGYWLYKKIRG